MNAIRRRQSQLRRMISVVGGWNISRQRTSLTVEGIADDPIPVSIEPQQERLRQRLAA